MNKATKISHWTYGAGPWVTSCYRDDLTEEGQGFSKIKEEKDIPEATGGTIICSVGRN